MNFQKDSIHLARGLSLLLYIIPVTLTSASTTDTFPEEPPQEPLPSRAPNAVETAIEAPQAAENLISEENLTALMEQNLGPDDDAGPPVILSPQAAIDLALKRNLGLAVTRYQPSISGDTLQIAESEFDPVISSSVNANDRVSPQAATNLEGVAQGAQPRNSGQSGEFGVSQKIPTGATVTAGTEINRSTTNSNRSFLNPEYTTNATLSVRQPLLRDFGAKVNLAEIAKARLALNQSRLAVRREVLDVIAAAEIRYWQLSAAKARKLLFDSNLELAENLLEENQERERLGLATRLDVLQAQASLAARSEDVILAQQATENAEDRLRTVLGDLNYGIEASLEVEELPEINPPVPEFREAVRSALAQDMDTQIQYEIIEQRKIDRSVARNRTLPTLDFTAGVGLLGLEGQPADAYDKALRGNGYNWSTGLELSFPWGMRSARAQLSTRKKQVLQEETELAVIQQELLLRLREAWRAVVAGKERTATTRASLVLNEESFVRERARYDAGASSFRNVLEAQRDFDEAKIRHLDAMIDLIESTVSLSRLDGTILIRHGFEWEEIDSETQTLPEPVEPLPVDNLGAPS
ncbi:TolC family protein [Rubellicoccus peritrichatus]|uniref:TolC family protein n=1 Tax=Rubellicoccus peritrichatus TaxID=3080537 RepID=A0AAQ3QS10_9BACT|nr:TolC family protein [Puniceicoccus sp. CR14]WOO41888.1 TolC family protein [Puniceicoccus sp. CR14]